MPQRHTSHQQLVNPRSMVELFHISDPRQTVSMNRPPGRGHSSPTDPHLICEATGAIKSDHIPLQRILLITRLGCRILG